MLVTGDKIGIFPVGQTGLGVPLENSAGVDWPLTHHLIENKVKRLIFRVPDIPADVYTLKVRTCCTNSNKKLLNDPRPIVYDEPLTVLAPLGLVPPSC